ncbi:heterodisulfide reductase-related iron-sulfur binding cluster [Georgenia sp. SUBG003]|uniref:heterodisulfide reductase-related iron-sulfur binding cluster n=1 Tax=Georgenia sp. SUBG003 TaxID=1497974 RepID=UPI003AB48A0F
MTDVGGLVPALGHLPPHVPPSRMIKVGDKPLRLLRAVAGIDLVALPEAQACCGFGGTFSLKNSETSAAMVHESPAGASTAAKGLPRPDGATPSRAGSVGHR